MLGILSSTLRARLASFLTESGPELCNSVKIRLYDSLMATRLEERGGGKSGLEEVVFGKMTRARELASPRPL